MILGPALLAVAALSASPERVGLSGTAAAPIRLTNHGAATLVVEARAGGLALDARGRPRLVAGGRTLRWLSVRPRVVSIPAGGAAAVEVAASPPRRAEPGDHHAVVLLTTRPAPGARVAVRMRLGVRVVVRVPGRIVHRLAVRRLRVRRGRLLLSVSVANLGNVTERIAVVTTLSRRGRRLATLRSAPRELLPRTRGLVETRYRGRLRGWITAVVEVRGATWAKRVFRVRL